jgi:signal transduction histidine kinase
MIAVGMKSLRATLPRGQQWLATLVLATGYAVGAWMSVHVASLPGSISPIWPLGGLVLALLLRGGLRYWPAIWLGDLVVALSLQYPPLVACLVASATSAEAICGTWLTQRLGGAAMRLERLREVLALIVGAAVVSTAIGATLATAVLALSGLIPQSAVVQIWVAWWVGGALSKLVLPPVILSLPSSRRLVAEPARIAEAIVFYVLLAASTWMVFNLQPNYIYIVLLMVVYAALRFAPLGAALATLLVTAVAMQRTAVGIGPFVLGTPSASLVYLQIFVGILGIASLALSAINAERLRSEAILRLSTELGASLNRSLDVTKAAQVVAEHLTKLIADWAVIDVLDGDGRAQRVAIACADPAQAELAEQLRRYPGRLLGATSGAMGARLLKGNALLIPYVSDQQLDEVAQNAEHRQFLKALRVRSAIIVPLLVGHEVVGLIGVHRSDALRPFSSDDLLLVESIAHQTARALEVARLHRRLADAERLESLGRLSGSVAHDFNGLLTVMIGTASLLREDLAPDSEQRAELDVIVDAAQRGQMLARQLLLFARRQPSAPQVIDLAESIAETTVLLRRLFPPNIEIVCPQGQQRYLILIDPSQASQIIMNLGLNSRDAMPDGGELRFELASVVVDQALAAQTPGLQAGTYVRLRVCDTGVGMDAQTLLRIFEPFFTTKGGGESFGLGLATVYGIVRHQGGAIAVQSAPGQGSCFSIYLPQQDDETRDT